MKFGSKYLFLYFVSNMHHPRKHLESVRSQKFCKLYQLQAEHFWQQDRDALTVKLIT